jgi:hypothetical protein
MRLDEVPSFKWRSRLGADDVGYHEACKTAVMARRAQQGRLVEISDGAGRQLSHVSAAIEAVRQTADQGITDFS